jgi:nucleoside-diphosphate-sugar epimerase
LERAQPNGTSNELSENHMGKRIFIAGATGAIGRPLVGMMRKAGHEIVAATRSAERAAWLRQQGVEAVEVDVFDAPALAAAMLAARPEVVMHQLTDLPKNLDPAQMPEAIMRNARIRDEGTRNLIAGGAAAGVRRIVAQSIAWCYAPGPLPHREADPLDRPVADRPAISLIGVLALERQVLAAPMAAVVLRYGHLYGPGTGTATAPASSPLHVDGAAYAALLAVGRGEGVYNIAETEDEVATDKARRELGWRPDLPEGAA